MPLSSFFGPSFPAKIEAVTSNNNNNFGNEKKAILFIACKNASPALNAVRARRNFIKFSYYIMKHDRTYKLAVKTYCEKADFQFAPWP